MNYIVCMVKSLHSTLYTVRVKVSYWAKLKMMFSSKASTVSQELKNIFKEVHWSHDVFILCTERNNVMRKCKCANSSERDVSGSPAYILAAVDELVYGYHSVFILIHLLLQADRRKDESQIKKVFLKPPHCDWQWTLPTTHLPEKTLLHADGASPLWGQGMCIFPSCRRWPSWCLAFPTTHGKGSVHQNYIKTKNKSTFP